MKTFKKISISAILTLALAAVLLSAPNALAAAPTLSLSSVSDGDSVQLTIAGDANSNVVFYYTKTGSGLQINYLGKTNSVGSFITSLSTASYGITGNTVVYVTVNSQKSNDAAWPYLAAGTVLSLNQTSVVLPLGDSLTLTAYNNGTNFIYLSSNSNPPVVNVNISGNSITLKALNFGSTVVNICAGTDTTPSCASAYVSVQNTGGKALAFSQNNPTVASGQNVAITVVGGTGIYTLLNNTNPNTIQASLSSNTVTLNTANTSGSSAITICSSDISSCGIINAVVGNVSSSGITFSTTNPIMTIGQSLSVTISGGAGGDYSVFSNTNTSAVSANISNNTLVLVANTGGTATVTVCSSMGNCSPEVATVNYNTATGGSMALSQNNLWLLAGQSSNITVSGGSLPYSVSGYSESILKASFSNNVLTATGVSAGSVSVNVCSSGGGCKILSVLVSGSSSSSGSSSLTLSQSSVDIKNGSNATVTISGGGSYFIAYNTNTSVASAVINGSNMVVNALAVGSTDVSICQNGGQCAVLKVTVSSDTASMSLSQTSLSLTVGSLGKILITGSGGYSISSNSNSNVVSTTISGSTAIVNAVSVGSANISICQNGGQCMAVAVTVTAAVAAVDGSGWTFCADEKGQCQFTGSQTVRYGANGKYIYGTFPGSALCANAVFGDPIENVAKQCAYGGTIPEGAKNVSDSSGWTSCADEKGQCSFSGYQTVRYGANGKYYYGSYLNGVGCVNSVFGDPVKNVAKQCFYGGTIPKDSTIVKFKFTKVLAYGASGNEVKELQQRLKTEGLYAGAIDGKFLTSTVAAVKKYQKNKGIKQTGNLGALTMAALNK